MFRYLIILIITLIIRSNARIVGGDDVSIRDRPYIVAIEYNGNYNCVGSIIAPKYVLTAGHCIHLNYDIKLLAIRSGSSFIQKRGKVTYIKDYHLPLDFTGIHRGDIAVLELKEPLEFGPSCQPIELFAANENVNPGENATVSGWGKTRKYAWSYQLQSVVLPIVDLNICQQLYHNLYEGQICAGYYDEGGKDSCNGDSGGPLVINKRQVAVVSKGYGCAQPHFPGVNTKVAYYRDWIDGIVNKENEKSDDK